MSYNFTLHVTKRRGEETRKGDEWKPRPIACDGTKSLRTLINESDLPFKFDDLEPKEFVRRALDTKFQWNKISPVAPQHYIPIRDEELKVTLLSKKKVLLLFNPCYILNKIGSSSEIVDDQHERRHFCAGLETKKQDYVARRVCSVIFQLSLTNDQAFLSCCDRTCYW